LLKDDIAARSRQARRFMDISMNAASCSNNFLRAAPKTHRHDIGMIIDARSTANDSAGRSPKPKMKVRAVAPTDIEFVEFDRLQQHSKSWVAAGEGWSCAGCVSRRDAQGSCC
jgi:hypothetical protein